MKGIYSLLSVVVMLVAAIGCEEPVERPLTEDEIKQLVLGEIEKSQEISYDLFASLARIHSDSLGRLKESSESKEKFVSLIADQTNTYFKEVVKERISDFNITSIPTPFAGEAEITLKLAASQEKTADALDLYSGQIIKELGETTDADHKDWIIIESMSSPATASEPLPTEEVALNFTKIKLMASKIPGVFADAKLTDEETMSAIDEILNAGEIPPVAIGLLLPAVQKVREAASTASPVPFDEAMVKWLGETVGLVPGSDGLDRDIIRRIHGAVFLAGLHALVLPDYKGENSDAATLSVLHAQYRAAILMTCGEIWDK